MGKKLICLAVLFFLGILSACSKENVAKDDKNEKKEAVLTQKENTNLVRLTYKDAVIEIIDDQNINYIDIQGDVNPMVLKGYNKNFTYQWDTELEFTVLDQARKKVANGIVLEELTEKTIFNIELYNGRKLENLEISNYGFGKGWLKPVVELVLGLIDMLKSDEETTELDELVIYDMKNCYQNHKIAMMNCVGGSVPFFADASTGECFIGNCIKDKN